MDQMNEREDEHLSLYQQQNQRLQLENRTLKLRVQGVQVLGKVLQESGEENEKLKQEVIELKEQLKEKGVDITSLQSLQSLSSLHSSTQHLDNGASKQPQLLPWQPQSGALSPGKPHPGAALPQQPEATPEKSTRCYLSKPGDNTGSLSESSLGAFEYVNMKRDDSSQSMDYSVSMASLRLGGDLHIKDLKTGFQNLKQDTEQLIIKVEEALKRCEGEDGCVEMTTRLQRLLSHLKSSSQEAKKRETFLWGLASEEEKLKEQFIQIENAQESQEKVMAQLKKQVDDGKQELGQLQDELDFLKEVVVVKRDDTPEAGTLSSPTSSSEPALSRQLTYSSTLSQVTEPGSRPSGSETGHICAACEDYKIQLQDLQHSFQQTRQERNDAITLKEQILDVNHAWDTQYKKLEAKAKTEINELKQQLEFFRSGDQDKKEKLWLSAKAMIDAEKKSKENAIEQIQVLTDKVATLEAERVAMNAELERYKSRATALEMHLSNPQNATGWTDTQSFWNQITQQQQLGQRPSLSAIPPAPPSLESEMSLPRDADLVNEIEVMKQQLRTYADDFTSERADRERAQSEKEKLAGELKAVKEQVLALEDQLRVYEEDFRRERQENERLRRQQQSNQKTRAVYRASDEHASEMTRRSQAVAEQQARLRALRDEYNMEERRLLQEQSQLERAQAMTRPAHTQYNPANYPGYQTGAGLYGMSWQQQPPMRARGPLNTQSSDDMFHGGEVQPDNRLSGREVVDAPDNTGSPNKCPRCLRAFPQGDQDALIRHVDRCIE